MMVIIGAVVLLVILGAAGVFVVLSGKSTGSGEASTPSTKADGSAGGGKEDKSDAGSTTLQSTPPSDGPASGPTSGPTSGPPTDPPTPLVKVPGYHGVYIGDFEKTAHTVAGNVYAANDHMFHIMQFTYDGNGPNATFMVTHKDEPGGDGILLPDETGSTKKLKEYSNADIMITLPDGRKIKDFKLFYILCHTVNHSFGHVEIPSNLGIPEEMALETTAFTSEDEANVNIASATLVDTKTMKISGLLVTADAGDIVISAGKSAEPANDGNAIPIKADPIGAHASDDLMIELPRGNWVDDVKWVGFFQKDATDATKFKKIAVITLPDPKSMKLPMNMAAPARRRRAMKKRRTAGMSAVKAAPSKSRLLVCSYGESGVVKTMVPIDGLCDVIFYTDVVYDGDAEAIVPRDGGPAFDVLKSAARKYKKTSFGTSMATGAIADAVKEKKSELMAAMGDLFSAKMVHLGMLNVENVEDYDKLKDADLQYIKVADEFLQGKSSSLTCHRALGVSLRDGSKGPKILDAAKQASSDFPELTMVIIKLHTENYGPTGDHWPLAPNPDDVDLSEHNALSFAAIKDDLEEQLQAISKQGKYALLSFAMFARTYRMKETWSGAAAREMSESSLNMDYSSVCKMKTEKDKEDTGTLYATDEHKKFLALFDSASTFTTKTNNRLSVMPKNFTGLAVYNVEMDDHKGTCGKGKFVRLKAIQAALAA